MRGVATKGAGFRWVFRIGANYPWIETLADGMPDIFILSDSEDGGAYEFFWTSPHFEDLDDAQRVEDRANELKALFDAAMYLYSGRNYYPLLLTDLTEWKAGEPKGHGRTEPDIGAYPFSLRAASDPKFGDPSHADDAGRAILLCRKDGDVLELMRFLGHNGATWVALFAVYEIVGREWDDKALAARAIASAGDIKRFTQTANNFQTLGPFARHSDLNWKPHKNPMKLTEAKDFIFAMARAFISERASKTRLGVWQHP
jgi:hypothetical protein